MAKDREHSQRDLFEHIEKEIFLNGKCVFRLCPKKPKPIVSILSRSDQSMEPQRLSVNRSRPDRTEPESENYFADVEQSAFNPANAVPGIGFSPTVCSRAGYSHVAMPTATGLGVNADSIPVNRLIVRCIIITGTGICVSTAMQVPASTTNRIVSTVRYPTRNTIIPPELEKRCRPLSPGQRFLHPTGRFIPPVAGRRKRPPDF